MLTTNGKPVLTAIPDWERAEFDGNKLLNKTDKPLWSNPRIDPPAIGSYVDIAGPRAEVATVLGYFVDAGWLMIWGERHSDGFRGDLAGIEIR